MMTSSLRFWISPIRCTISCVGTSKLSRYSWWLLRAELPVETEIFESRFLRCVELDLLLRSVYLRRFCVYCVEFGDICVALIVVVLQELIGYRGASLGGGMERYNGCL